jgi:hypothetical protein
MIDGLNLSQIQRFRVALASKHPARWQVLRGKSGFNVVDIRSRPGGEELLTVSATNGVIPRSQTTVTMFKAQSYIGHKLCWPRDLVVNRLRAWMQGLGFFQAPRSHQFGLQRLSAKTLLCQALAILSLPTPVLPPQRAARRGRAGRFQGGSQSVRAHLRFSFVHFAVHERGLGEALYLPQLPHSKIACTGGARSLKRYS